MSRLNNKYISRILDHFCNVTFNQPNWFPEFISFAFSVVFSVFPKRTRGAIHWIRRKNMLQGIRFRRVQILQFWWDNFKTTIWYCTDYSSLPQVTPGTRRLETVPGIITGIRSSCWGTLWRRTTRRSSSGCLMTTSYTMTPSRDYSLTTNIHIKEKQKI